MTKDTSLESNLHIIRFSRFNVDRYFFRSLLFLLYPQELRCKTVLACCNIINSIFFYIKAAQKVGISKHFVIRCPPCKHCSHIPSRGPHKIYFSHPFIALSKHCIMQENKETYYRNFYGKFFHRKFVLSI